MAKLRNHVLKVGADEVNGAVSIMSQPHIARTSTTTIRLLWTAQSPGTPSTRRKESSRSLAPQAEAYLLSPNRSVSND